MAREHLNVVIGGEAGQGLVTIAMILCRALVRAGYYLVVTQSYQSRIRGGHNSFAIRIATRPLVAPIEAADLLVALNEETVAIHRHELTPDGLILLDAAIPAPAGRLLRVPFAELASGQYLNVAYLGVLTELLGLSESLVYQALEDQFGTRDQEVAARNRSTFLAAYEWARQQQLPATDKLAPAAPGGERLLLNGNEAIALGAIAGGVKFCSFYPMTPATSIALTLQSAADLVGVIVEQAEDEIAAINMAIGASFAGAPAMVATSGGGFALMVEGVSLAAMTETPIFIVVAQRPGPATGLPTRTEQADLEFVLHAGHGEFPRAIFAPATPEECFILSRRALYLAEKYQTPVFLLTDQFLADSYRAVSREAVAGLEPVKAGCAPEEIALPYERYALTPSGISPRLLPGLTEHLVVADSDEHFYSGHLTEDLQVRVELVNKRLRKAVGLRTEVLPPAYAGPERPELLLVTWGSSWGAVQEAAAYLEGQGKKVGTLSFSQVWPLVPEQFLPFLLAAKTVVTVESNAFGQFARLLRRETGFQVHRQIRRYDGLPLTPGYILGHLES